MEWNISATTDKTFAIFFCNFITINFSIYMRFLKFLHLAISFQIKKKKSFKLHKLQYNLWKQCKKTKQKTGLNVFTVLVFLLQNKKMTTNNLTAEHPTYALYCISLLASKKRLDTIMIKITTGEMYFQQTSHK